MVIVTVIIVQVPDTFAQEVLTSSLSLTHEHSPKFDILLAFKRCSIFVSFLPRSLPRRKMRLNNFI